MSMKLCEKYRQNTVKNSSEMPWEMPVEMKSDLWYDWHHQVTEMERRKIYESI